MQFRCCRPCIVATPQPTFNGKMYHPKVFISSVSTKIKANLKNKIWMVQRTLRTEKSNEVMPQHAEDRMTANYQAKEELNGGF